MKGLKEGVNWCLQRKTKRKGNDEIMKRGGILKELIVGRRGGSRVELLC